MDLLQPIAWVLYGSSDGADHDVALIAQRPFGTKEAQLLTPLVEKLLRQQHGQVFGADNKQLNINFCVVSGGNVSWCYKGTPDELNNSILIMYGEHGTAQLHPNFITSRMERNVILKILRCLRVLICSVSRSNVRHLIEPVLKNVAFSGRLAAISQLKFEDIKIILRSRDTLENIWKGIAFQMGQTLALVEGDEIFGKRRCAERFPVLESFLYRKEITPDRLCELTKFKDENFVPAIAEFVKKNCPNVDELSEFD